MTELTIAIPVKDGEAWLRHTLEDVAAFIRSSPLSCDVVVVDDGSRDGTAKVLEDFRREHSFLTVLTHDRNRGKGAALKTAIVASRGEFVLTMDADATHSAAGARPCLAALREGADAAIGNRRDPRTRFVLRPRDFGYVGWRHFLGWVFNRIARALVGVRVHDTQCGFKAYRGSLARWLFPQVKQERFAFDIEVLALLAFHDKRIAEVPVEYVYRHQVSTVKLFRDGLRMLAELVHVRATLARLRRTGPFVDPERPDYQFLALRQGHPVQRFWHGKKWPLAARLLELAPTDRLLDVGAGSSEVTLAAGAGAALVCGVDRSSAAMAFMRGEAARRGGSRPLFIAGDIHRLPLADATFDKICVLEVIEHLEERGASWYLAELRRVLRPGGRLLLTTPNYQSYWPALECILDRFGGAAEMDGVQHVTRFHSRRLRAALEQSGFELLRMGSVYHVSPFLSLLSTRAAELVFAWEAASGGALGPMLYAVVRSKAA